MPHRALYLLLCFLLAPVPCALADQAPAPVLRYRGDQPRIQQPLPPTDSMRLIQTPPGFSVSLFAAEPNVVNPIAFSWDHRGRCFVVQSRDYPHDLKRQPGRDRVTICEDRNGDGRADTFTDFAANLSLVTGIVCVEDGVVLAQMPDVNLWQDTDGDGKADKKTRLFTGFGLHDTHAGPNSLTCGIDNHFYGAVGYSGFATNEAKLRNGIFRFSRDGDRFEPLAQFNNNTWGLGISEDNLLFGSTANNHHFWYVGIPQRYGASKNAAAVHGHYEVSPIAKDPLQQVDVRGGFTAACGARVYTARSWPQEYWNSVAFVCEPTAHLVHLAKLERHGAGVREVDGGNVFASGDHWTAPVHAEVGPDGQLWVADWYSPVIQHNADKRGMPNQVWNNDRGAGNAHRNPLRDYDHGRIYRVVHEAVKPTPPPRLETPEDHVAALKHPNMFWRLTAQQRIIDRQLITTMPLLRQLIADRSVDELALNPGALHALYTLVALDPFDIKPAEAALQHPSPAVRRAALQLIPPNAANADRIAKTKLLQDPDPFTRLAAILRSSQMPRTPALAAAAASERSSDEWLQAAWQLFDDQAPAPTAAEVSVWPPTQTDYAFRLTAVPDKIAFDRRTLYAKAGAAIAVGFTNTDHMPHNLVFLKTTSLAAFGAEVDAFIATPDAAKRHYVPPSDAVLAATQMLNPDASETLVFTAPATPGEYPFVCTFPGHWRIMNGILVVKSDKPGPRVLVTGGGGKSHDFRKLWGTLDANYLKHALNARVTYTEDTQAKPPALADFDTLIICNNKPFGETWRTAILDFARQGKGLVISHPGVWYNWQNWAVYNLEICAGGSRSHEKFQPFDVEVTQPDHPVMTRVPASFAITDELYRSAIDPKAAGAEILAIGRSRETGKTYPVVWIAKHPNARIVCNSLGHNEQAHNHPAYQQILANSVRWTGSPEE